MTAWLDKEDRNDGPSLFVAEVFLEGVALFLYSQFYGRVKGIRIVKESSSTRQALLITSQQSE